MRSVRFLPTRGDEFWRGRKNRLQCKRRRFSNSPAIVPHSKVYWVRYPNPSKIPFEERLKFLRKGHRECVITLAELDKKTAVRWVGTYAQWVGFKRRVCWCLDIKELGEAFTYQFKGKRLKYRGVPRRLWRKEKINVLFRKKVKTAHEEESGAKVQSVGRSKKAK